MLKSHHAIDTGDGRYVKMWSDSGPERFRAESKWEISVKMDAIQVWNGSKMNPNGK